MLSFDLLIKTTGYLLPAVPAPVSFQMILQDLVVEPLNFHMFRFLVKNY